MRAMRRQTYHHGNLREGLVECGLALLAERGVEGFTLRECARRLGVSATAAAHHFGDVNGLFAAMAARGYRAITSWSVDRVKAATDDPVERFRELCGAYLAFAAENPDLYRITFGKLIRKDDPELASAAVAAFNHFAQDVAEARGVPARDDDPAFLAIVVLAWATLHGLATLTNDGRLGFASDEAHTEVMKRLAELDRRTALDTLARMIVSAR